MENPFRKVIQISSTDKIITALCNDGTLWEYYHSEWTRIRDVPTE